MTNDENPSAAGRPGRTRRILIRVFSILVAAFIIGCVTSFIARISNRQPGPAGFLRGMLHGALMPGALPNLLVGNDVTIYAQNNTGVSYKLGYTMGVNGCGAIFFGYFFWRLNRWRKRLRVESDSDRAAVVPLTPSLSPSDGARVAERPGEG